MKISFNPSNSNKNILDLIKNNKDIIFDLKGHSIFARGVEFKGTDTNTWRDIKINNVSIGSHTLDLRNGSNTTLTNTNGVVTINSTWRPVVDNLTSDSTTSSLSAKQGKVLKALIDGKSNSDHNHDGIYVRAFRTSNDNIDSDWGQSFKTFDPIPLGTPPEKNPNISLLSIGENFNRRKQLAFIWNNDNIYYRRRIDSGFTNWRRLAFANEIPTSLKNPYALTISLNGTSQGPYDGSAAKNINITPGSIGAAVSNHSHDYLVVNPADDKSFNSAYHNFQVLYAAGGNGITGKPANVDAFGLFRFRAASGWSGQMLLDNGGSLYIRSSEDAKMTNTLAWKTILDSSNYSGILDSRYYTESEVNSLLSRKLDRVNLTTGSWNPRGYHLAADYCYNGGDLSISENNGKMYVSVDGCFWQNEGQYRVLDTSDIGDIRDSVTLHQYLSATDATWYPLVWGGSSHYNTSDSTGPIYKSYDKLSWQTSSQTLYATNIQTNNIKNLSIGGGIYWNPYVESASDNTEAASITLVRSGVAGGTTLVLSQMNDTNDTIQFKTNTAARLYHNSYPILTTQNTYVSNNKGYIYGNEITQVNNADKVDNRHAISTTPNTGIIYKAAIYTAHSLTSYWVRLASIPSIGQNEEFVATIHVQSGHSGFGRNAILLVYLRGGASSYLAKGFNICCNSNYNPNRFRLYYKDSDKTSEIWYQTTGQQDGIITTVISQSSEGFLYEGLTLYSGIITAVQTPSMSTYLSAQVSTITDNISGNASTATKLQTARSLWGNMFDGTNNIYGRILINPTNATGSYDEGIRIKSHNNWSVVVLCGNDNTADTGTSANTWGLFNNNGNFCINRNNAAGHTGYELCNINGNWGVGTNSPVCKLHVNGAGHFTDYVNIPTLRIYGTSDNMSWNRGPGRIIFAENTSDDQALSLVYTSYDSVRSPAGIKLTGSQGNEWFEAPRIIKTGSSDSYVLLGGGGHKLESSLNVAYSNLKGIFLTGGDSNNEGYRLIFEKTMGGWDINYGVWAIAFRHSGRGTLNIGFDTTNSDGSTYSYDIRFLGSTVSRESTPFRAFYNSTTKVFRIYWHYYDYTSGNIAVLRGNIEPHNGTWMASLPNNVGTELAITCNRADSATYADTVEGYHANELLTALSNSNNGISITVGGTTKSVSNISVNYASSAGNANTLDGYPANGSNVAPYGHIPTIESDGVMEVGKYIDFHNDNNGKHDFSTRLQSTGNYGNEVNLPSASGTLALTSDILNYYWANVKISTSSSTTTSPTVSNLTATSSIRMSNISLEHTDEINNITNGGIHLNYRNSGNVSLCYGGGNVGIGTTSPTQKLDVIGNIRATGQLHLPTNGNYNAILMGDDCWMGDCNISNVIGLSGTSNANSGGIKFGRGGMYIGYNGSSHYSSGTSLWTNFNADTVDGEHASNFSYTHQSSFDFSKRKSGRIVTFDQSGTDYGWINGFASTHNNCLTSVIFNEHRSSNWYVGYMEGNMSTGETHGLQAVHKLAFADGDASYPIFLGYLNLYSGKDGTISSSFPCLGYSVPFTYTRGGAYCLINIPDTSFQTFYIEAAIASVHHSGAGMGHWVGNHRGDGAWWLHCEVVGFNAVQVKGFHPANGHNDSWWGGNPLYTGDGAAKIITVCLFGCVQYK